MCSSSEESMDCLLLHCPMALALWRRLFQLMDTCWAAPSYTLMLLNDCKCFGLSKKGGGCCGIVQYELFLVDLVWSAI